MPSVLLPTVQCSRYYWSNSSASVKLKIKVLLANIVAVCIGCSCPDFDCGEGAVLSLRGQELPYARYSSNGTGLSPAATLVVHLMITHLRKAQNTREQRRNEVLDRTVKTPRSGEKGKVVSSTWVEVALWKQMDTSGTASGEEPTLEQLYPEGHGKDSHCNRKKCEDEGAAERNSYELTVPPYSLYFLSYRKDTDESWVKKWHEG